MYEPENWKIAVNNDNFRLSIARWTASRRSWSTSRTTESIVFNTITPPNFADINGQDYVNMGDLEGADRRRRQGLV